MHRSYKHSSGRDASATSAAATANPCKYSEMVMHALARMPHHDALAPCWARRRLVVCQRIVISRLSTKRYMLSHKRLAGTRSSRLLVTRNKLTDSQQRRRSGCESSVAAKAASQEAFGTHSDACTGTILSAVPSSRALLYVTFWVSFKALGKSNSRLGASECLRGLRPAEHTHDQAFAGRRSQPPTPQPPTDPMRLAWIEFCHRSHQS